MQDDLISLKALAQKRANHTVWFTHFPSAIISTDHHALRQLMSTSIVHVCGHLHTLGGLMPRMYGKHPGGHLELELGDFAHSKRFDWLVNCMTAILFLSFFQVSIDGF